MEKKNQESIFDNDSKERQLILKSRYYWIFFLNNNNNKKKKKQKKKTKKNKKNKKKKNKTNKQTFHFKNLERKSNDLLLTVTILLFIKIRIVSPLAYMFENSDYILTCIHFFFLFIWSLHFGRLPCYLMWRIALYPKCVHNLFDLRMHWVFSKKNLYVLFIFGNI